VEGGAETAKQPARTDRMIPVTRGKRAGSTPVELSAPRLLAAGEVRAGLPLSQEMSAASVAWPQGTPSSMWGGRLTWSGWRPGDRQEPRSRRDAVRPRFRALNASRPQPGDWR